MENEKFRLIRRITSYNVCYTKLLREAAHPYNSEQIEDPYEMHDAEDFKKKYVEILALKPDGVILAPILKKESLLFCTQLDELKIPYAFIDTNLKETNCLSFIGEDVITSYSIHYTKLYDHQ